ncbi:sialate O-acetylesterase [Bifidobacterium apri]|uniref:Sialic acidspecific 9-O-acetylesterase n=1 Tax=Bifidobacterium apri TaxID=1769423 RepID=A0A6A2VY27_9BIFI|nr:sialate O-acetylesterase [Bifidobacterium apri]KAB8299353.1 sialic acidspecific 9-O-acetylesterase [Bifidobacterium apri]
MNARIVTGPAPGTTSTTTTATTTQPVTGPAPGSDAGGANATVARANKPQGTADFSVAAVFSHHMVLQRHRPIPVFGHGKPGMQLRVRLLDTAPAADSGAAALIAEAAGQILPDGSWRILLPSQEAGGPYQLEIRDLTGTQLVFHDVMIGEVWIASGQSNMEFELHSTREAAQAIAQSADPMLRFYNTPKSGDISDALFEAERESSWQACSPDTTGTMSAVAYYFAARLRRQFGTAMPIGIIDCYIGGTSITCWMDQATIESSDAGRPYWQRYQQALAGHTEQDFHDMTLAWKTKFDHWNAQIESARTANPNVSWDELNAAYGECPWPPPVTPHSQYRPTGAFTAMVARIAPYAVRGVLWYQGEEDAPYSASYAVLLRQMIALWRRVWRIDIGADADQHSSDACTEHTAYTAYTAELPFIIIQLPQWIDRATDEAHADPLDWPVIRDTQWSASRDIPGVTTVCTIDCGEYDNIHPYDKRTVGERAAAIVLRTMYGYRQIAAWGPEPLEIQSYGNTDDGGGVLIRYRHATGLRFNGTVPGTGNTDTLDAVSRAAGQSGFELAGADGIFHDATAQIVPAGIKIGGTAGIFGRENSVGRADDGTPLNHATVSDTPISHTPIDDSTAIRVYSPDVPQPAAIRYAWKSWGPAPVRNAAGLPAIPFRASVSRL